MLYLCHWRGLSQRRLITVKEIGKKRWIRLRIWKIENSQEKCWRLGKVRGKYFLQCFDFLVKFRFTSFIIHIERVRAQTLSSECKLTRFVLQTGWLSYHPTSWRKSVLIQYPSAQIPKAFNQRGIADKTKYLGINA